jgi:flagellar hook-associated protein 1 FlgK
LGGEAGRLAVLSQRSADGAQAIAKVALERRAESEGVSIDDEVIRMNAYQQAYAAAARVIQAANEMWQTLLAIR